MKEIHYFLDSIAVQGLSENTVTSYKRDLEKFSQFFKRTKGDTSARCGPYDDGTFFTETKKKTNTLLVQRVA